MAQNDSGDAACRLPNRVCATCGQPTGGKGKGGVGSFHADCRRDSKGCLIIDDGRERSAA